MAVGDIGTRPRLVEATRHLYPGYFALVMATGIVSTALADLGGHPALSGLLLAAALASFAILTAALAIRAVAFPRDLAADLSAPDRAYGFFTFVAACGVLGSRLAADGHLAAACALALVAALAWAGLSYGVPVRLILGPRPKPVLAGVNGTWFIWVVGTQSLAVISTVLCRVFPAEAALAGLTAVLMWSVGVVLYLIVAALVLTRLLLLEVRPADLTAPYWIAMGATAITVLAAAKILSLPATPAVTATRPLVTGFAVVLWAFGTWLIPLLALFSGWRHALRRVRVTYQPQLWSVVFPLGMYAVASMEAGRAVRLPLVEHVGRAWVWVALAAWAVTFPAMLVSLARRSRR